MLSIHTLQLRFLLLFSLFYVPGISQDSVQPKTVTVVAGPEYARSSFYQVLWGRHYRKEWTTPVRMPLYYLDTAMGGLKPYEAGGGRQSKTLRLRTASNREYVLRSIDKRFGKALPVVFQNTFIEDAVNDQVSIAHPFSAITISGMADAAGIYHTRPQIIYLPKQPGLDSFNEDYGDNLYLLEQRPDEDWSDAENFGSSTNIISTEKLLQKLFADNDNRVDGDAYIRARLFDIFVGDWGRHEDQWRWASYKDGNKTLYKPIPRDRDQAYTLFDGLVVKTILSVADLDHLQTFEATIPEIGPYNFPARNLDRKIANETDLEDWVRTATSLKESITDAVIEASVRRMPPEVFPLGGEAIIAKLKRRRDDLVQHATTYYRTLAEEVDVTGTSDHEYFEVNRLSNEDTRVNVYKIDKERVKGEAPIYSRVYKSSDTKEIRLSWLGGRDIYSLEGSVERGPLVRIIGGSEADSIRDASSVKRGGRTHIYDDNSNEIAAAPGTRVHLSSDSSIHEYRYDAFRYNDRGFKPSISYGSDDRLFVGLGYRVERHGWRKLPFASLQKMNARYSITQNAVSLDYVGTFIRALGKWNLGVLAHYDAIRWTNFFGIGNNTVQATDDRDFYRTRSKEVAGTLNFNRPLGKNAIVQVAPFYRQVDIRNDTGRFVAKVFSTVADRNAARHFGGALASLSVSKVDDAIVPRSGVQASGIVTFTQNLKEADRKVTRYEGTFNFFIPLTRRFVLAVHNGAATLSGKPEFYQLNSIGGSRTVRGYLRDRFWGKSSFYNSNELQYIFNFKSYLFNGQAGFVGFYDHGRVWQPGETSTGLHSGYGAGILIAPFHKLSMSVTYGISTEDRIIHLRLNQAF
jgi:hypothetical protein